MVQKTLPRARALAGVHRGVRKEVNTWEENSTLVSTISLHASATGSSGENIVYSKTFDAYQFGDQNLRKGERRHREMKDCERQSDRQPGPGSLRIDLRVLGRLMH